MIPSPENWSSVLSNWGDERTKGKPAFEANHVILLD
jgi:hypothetical protein